jgi:hypothetical protein
LIASTKTFLQAQKPNLMNGNHLLVWHKIFGTGTKCISTFTFGLAQKNLGPVEGRGIRVSFEFVAFILLPMFEGHLVVVNHQLYCPSQTMMNKSYEFSPKSIF